MLPVRKGQSEHLPPQTAPLALLAGDLHRHQFGVLLVEGRAFEADHVLVLHVLFRRAE